MGRSGYSDEHEESELNLYRGAVESAIRGKRGQQFFRDLIAALDAMPVKELITGELEDNGAVCALGSLGQSRSLDMSNVDTTDSDTLGDLFGIARSLAAETMFMNDDDFGCYPNETPAERWTRMRAWATENIKP